ncbi:hypothetical protein LZ554_000554 [Drepanopeziza brunnea f. sp. 'monogermtubi']|nr:hypothetical protein LZ554_000554 [Drepanopeziza brunnea f. sp. 'monogermtubi']
MSRNFHGEAGAGPLQRGRLRYQKQDYEGAVEAFTEAVDMSTDHMRMTALDARAATYEKLQQLLPALRDARSMIELKPKQSKGYLRAGKILQLQEKQDLALKIYARGLEKVPASGTDRDRQHLTSFYEQLRSRMKPSKNRDILGRLPLELALMVCHHLSMRDRVIGLAVCKGWKKMLEGHKELWTTLDTSYARKAVSLKSLQIHFRRSSYTLDRALITLRAYIDERKMKHLTKYCKQLRELHISGSGSIGDTLVSALPGEVKIERLTISQNTEITLHYTQMVLHKCRDSLIDVKFLKVTGSKISFIPGRWSMAKSIKSIHLGTVEDACLDFNGLRDATPNATSVILNGWKIMLPLIDAKNWTALERLDLTNTSITSLPKYPATLKHLVLRKNPKLTFGVNDELPAPLPLLETFACSSTSLDGNALKLIVGDSIEGGNLKSLELGDRHVNERPNLVKDDFPASETVEELSLAGMLLDDRSAPEVVGLYPNLKRLDMSNTRITGVSVKAFVKMGIKWLKINGCDSISIDAVQWARGKDVEVNHNFVGQGVQMRQHPSIRDSAFANNI